MVREIGTDYEAGSRINWDEHLERGENLLWEGQPKGGLRYTMMVAMVSGIGFASLIFSLFWIFATRRLTEGVDNGFDIFPLFGVPFAVIGLILTIAPWVFDIYARSRTNYALTDQRILIARGAFPKGVGKSRLSAGLNISLRGNGPYSVTFLSSTVMTDNGPARTYSGFSYIEDGPEVYELLKKTVDKLA